jgi:DNA-directed RNA polymerase specialized sigma24 family protein
MASGTAASAELTSSLLESLVEAAQAGDRERFDEAFDACVERVYGLAWNVLRNRERAEAVTAQVLVEAVKGIR